MTEFSKTQIDKLGDRLRTGDASDEDLRMLNDFRSGFAAVFGEVQKRLHALGLIGEISGRAAKTTTSIVQKLRREQTRHVRLSQIQDICGVRIVVASVKEQDLLAERLMNIFPDSSAEDRRENPSHGYRAVHVIATLSGLHAEIQVRTEFQHMWAQFCEHLADKLGVEVKYGGHPAAQTLLDTLSEAIRNLEDAEGADFVRENPLTNPAARADFVLMFQGLVRFVAQGPRKSSEIKEADRVLPD